MVTNQQAKVKKEIRPSHTPTPPLLYDFPSYLYPYGLIYFFFVFYIYKLYIKHLRNRIRPKQVWAQLKKTAPLSRYGFGRFSFAVTFCGHFLCTQKKHPFRSASFCIGWPAVTLADWPRIRWLALWRSLSHTRQCHLPLSTH